MPVPNCEEFHPADLVSQNGVPAELCQTCPKFLARDCPDHSNFVHAQIGAVLAADVTPAQPECGFDADALQVLSLLGLNPEQVLVTQRGGRWHASIRHCEQRDFSGIAAASGATEQEARDKLIIALILSTIET